MSYLETFLFGIYPYVALAVFFIGSLIRYDREQYTWKSESSQLLRRGQLRLGSNLFHIGIIALFFGHAVGLLMPTELYTSAGLKVETKQMLAIVMGAIFGTMCLVGLILLVHRRLATARIRSTSTTMDIFILLWILVTLILGLATIFISVQHTEGGTMVALGHWAQRIVTFRAGAVNEIADVHWLYKTHLFFGMTVFLLFPFSRLVHVWSGFAAVAYLFRPYQVVRRRSRV